MRNTVCLANACGESRQTDSTAFEKDHEQTAASSEMFFRELKHFLLLLPKSKRDESPLVPIANIKP
jgi:hypothetical protein